MCGDPRPAPNTAPGRKARWCGPLRSPGPIAGRLLLPASLLAAWGMWAPAGQARAAAGRVPLDWLLAGRGSLSAATVSWDPTTGRGTFAGVRLALPRYGLQGEIARVESPGAAATTAAGGDATDDGTGTGGDGDATGAAAAAAAATSEPALVLQGARLTVDLGVLLRTAPAEGVEPPHAASSRPGAAAAAGQTGPEARPGGPSWREGQPLVRLLDALARLAGPTPSGPLALLPPLRLEGGELALIHPGASLALEQAEIELRPGRPLRIVGVLRGPARGAGRVRLSLGWPTRTEKGELRLQGVLALQEGTLDHPAVAQAPLAGLAAEAQLSATHDPERATLRVELAPLQVQGIEARLQLDLERLGRGPLAGRIQLDLPRQPCQRLADALPRPLAPLLAGMRLDGQMAGGLAATLDLRHATEPLQSLGLRGPPLLGRCQPATLGKHLAVERLAGPFVQTVRPPDRALPEAKIGPGTRDYVPLDDLPAHVARSMLLTEDMGFFRHGPLALGLIRKAVNMDLRQGRYVYGGSTITQQLAKNLFFDGDKTLSRKLQEAFVAWKMEQVLTKERILELYVNCIEYAPGVYGIERAARYYFAHGAAELTPVEGVFLAVIKPLPSDGPRMARKGKVDGWWIKRMGEVMRTLAQEGEITPEELQAAAPYQPLFRPDFKEFSKSYLRPHRQRR